MSIARDIGDTLRETKQYVNLGYVAQHDGDQDGAKANFQQYLALALEMDSKSMMAYGLVALAGPATAMGQPQRAARLLGAGYAHFGQLGVTAQPGDRPEFARSRASVREQLDEATFDTALAEGRAMSLEEAIAYALEGADSDG